MGVGWGRAVYCLYSLGEPPGKATHGFPSRKVRLVQALGSKKPSCFLLAIESCSKVSELKMPNLFKSKEERGKEISIKLKTSVFSCTLTT